MSEKAPIDGHLKHKAIVSTIDYRFNDGPYDPSNTDVRALSLGKATWDNDEISAKVWRHTGDNWSRASEDLPLHRVLDLTILLLSALLHDGDQYKNHYLDLSVIDNGSLSQLQAYLDSHKIYLDERLREIQLLLKKYLI